MVKIFLPVKHEFYFNRKNVKVVSYFIRQSFHAEQSRVVFLCRDDHFRFGHLCERFIYPLDVFLCELMMVGICQRGDVLRIWAEVINHLLWRRNSGQQENVLVILYAV